MSHRKAMDLLGSKGKFKSDTWDMLAELAACPHPGHVLLTGPPGTGKTTFGHVLAQLRSVECLAIPLTDETTAIELRGHFVVGQGGGMEWMEGPMHTAWTAPGVLLVDEIDHGSGDTLTMLHTICDPRAIAKLTLPTGKTIRPAEGFVCVATSNQPPDVLPEALASRFVHVEVNEPSPAAVVMLPEDLREPAWHTARILDKSQRICIRSWFRFASLRDQLSSVETAATLAFGSKGRAILDSLSIGLLATATASE